jgi:hypothetical protein
MASPTIFHKVRIIKASKPTYWYADKIDSEYLVTIEPLVKEAWWFKNDFTAKIVPIGVQKCTAAEYLEAGDFVILESFEGRLKETVTVTVTVERSPGFSVQSIERVREALMDDAAGNRKCSMTDIDLAAKMLTEMVMMKSCIVPSYSGQVVTK